MDKESIEIYISEALGEATANSVILRLNWLDGYSDLFLKETGDLAKLIGLFTTQKNILREELEEAKWLIENLNK